MLTIEHITQSERRSVSFWRGKIVLGQFRDSRAILLSAIQYLSGNL
jgi:hypothetical protein